jgi:hypothetical protein
MPGFHEVRALSLHLYKKAGKDGQKIAGHASEQLCLASSRFQLKRFLISEHRIQNCHQLSHAGH